MHCVPHICTNSFTNSPGVSHRSYKWEWAGPLPIPLPVVGAHPPFQKFPGDNTQTHINGTEQAPSLYPFGVSPLSTVQLCTGHSPLLAAYLPRIGCRDSATCPHCNGVDETAKHLVIHCPAHDQARRESWPNLHYQSDPRRQWSFQEKIGAVTRPPDRE